MPPPARLGTRTPRQASVVPAPHLQPLLRRQLQLPLQLRARLLPVDEIAKPAPHAPVPAVQPAAGLAEIRDRGQFGVDGPRRVPAAVELVAGGLRAVFVFEARVDVAY